MIFDLAGLPWLPTAPDDFRRLCRGIADKTDNWAHDLRALSQHALNESHLTTLARTLRTLRENNGGNIPGLQPFRLGLVSNATTKLLVPALSASAVRYGVDLNVVEADFNQVMQAATAPDSKIISTQPNAIMLALDHRGYEGLQSGIKGSAGDAIEYFKALRDSFRQRFQGTLMFQTVPRPPEQLFGSLDAKLEQTQRGRIDRFNHDIADIIRDSSDVLLDLAGLAHGLGTQNWFDDMQWHLAKLPFAQQYVPYMPTIARALSARLLENRANASCLISITPFGAASSGTMGWTTLYWGKARRKAKLSWMFSEWRLIFAIAASCWP